MERSDPEEHQPENYTKNRTIALIALLVLISMCRVCTMPIGELRDWEVIGPIVNVVFPKKDGPTINCMTEDDCEAYPEPGMFMP